MLFSWERRRRVAMGSERLEYVDILKGIGILLVIFSHSGAENEETMVYVGGVFIPLFFVVSGYTYKHRDQPFLMLMKKKARRLLLPYFFFSTILLLLYKRFSLLDVIGVFYSRYCLYPYNNTDNLYLMGGGNPPLWFLTSMLTAFIPFYFLMKYPSRTKWLLLFYTLFTFLCQYLPILLPWSIDTACLQASFIYIGVIFRQDFRLLNRPSYLYLLVFIAFVIVCTFNGVLNVSVREYGSSFLLYFLTGVLGTLFLLWLSQKLESSFTGSLLAGIGRHSLVIFCVQMFLLRIMHQLFHDFMHFPAEGLLFYGVSILKVLLVAFMGMFISKGMNRYMSWLFR